MVDHARVLEFISPGAWNRVSGKIPLSCAMSGDSLPLAGVRAGDFLFWGLCRCFAFVITHFLIAKRARETPFKL